MMRPPKAADVVVAGGGPAGSATALVLARAGVSTLVLESRHRRAKCLGETLPPLANALLQNLGVWDRFCGQKHLPADGIISLWGNDRQRVNDFFNSPQGPGWNLDRSRFDGMLLEQSRKAGARVIRGARITSCRRSPRQEWRLEFERDGTTYQTSSRYLVDATGNTGARSLSFLSRTAVMDRLIGVARVFPGSRASPYTLVEAVEDGWFFSASVPHDRLVVLYFTDADIYARRRKEDPRYWAIQLEKALHTRGRIENGDNIGNPVVVSAATRRRLSVTGDGWIAVGDAALSFDPLSSLGIFKALDSGSRAGKLILTALNGAPLDPGYQIWSDQVFSNYLRHRVQFYSEERRWVGSLFWQRRQVLCS